MNIYCFPAMSLADWNFGRNFVGRDAGLWQRCPVNLVSTLFPPAPVTGVVAGGLTRLVGVAIIAAGSKAGS